MLPIREYRLDRVAWFFSKNDPNWNLSNMAGGMPLYWPPTRAPANKWRSSEHLYQSAKYPTAAMRLPADGKATEPCVRTRIRCALNGLIAKRTQLCAEDAGLVRDDWDHVKVHAMHWVLELKFFWNPNTFAETLMATGDLDIVEISSYDDFWGCLHDPKNPDIVRGSNMLGHLLMRVRSNTRNILHRRWTFPRGFLPD